MKLGFLNACLMDWEPERVVRFASENGFQAVEFHGGPRYQKVSWDAIANNEVDVVREPEISSHTASGEAIAISININAGNEPIIWRFVNVCKLEYRTYIGNNRATAGIIWVTRMAAAIVERKRK